MTRSPVGAHDEATENRLRRAGAARPEKWRVFMQDQYSRTQLLLGKEAMETLHHSRVAVFGIGGVGG